MEKQSATAGDCETGQKLAEPEQTTCHHLASPVDF